VTVDRVRVGDILKLVRRPVIVDPLAEYEEIGIRSFGRGIFHKESISGVALGNKRVFAIYPGELVLSNVFAWEGGIAVSSAADEGKIGSHRFMTYQPVDNNQVDISWAGWFFLSDAGMDLIRKASPGSAGRNRTLAVERFEALQILLPRIDEQRRVAGDLDRASGRARALEVASARSGRLASSYPASVAAQTVRKSTLRRTRLGDVLEQIQRPVEIDPGLRYTNMGIRAFGRGTFLYPECYGRDLGKLRFFEVPSGALAVSNIKAWEGAVSRSGERRAGLIASNRFLFFSARSGQADIRCVQYALLSEPGLEALGRASQGSADRNRTLARQRFEDIELDLPDPGPQLACGEAIERAELVASTFLALARKREERVRALMPALRNQLLSRDQHPHL